MAKLTFTMENYLEAVYELSDEGGGARVSDIAERLGVTKASTNSAMATLSEKGLVTNEKYGEIFLTPAGRVLAELTSNKHRTIQKFFSQVLQLDFETADTDACAIEHVISNDAIGAMQAFMRTYKRPAGCAPAEE
ncbi:MAG: metal-dependent transcriptional regulator [Christensenellales bacterium]|jgi:DtxR family Mn-dependent transcriptional regulator